MALQQDSEDPMKKRRARNDPHNRDFKCPCGKSYLSYPALFTHVKQKHNGKAPGPLIKPKNQNVKRGRPRGNSLNIEDEQELLAEEPIIDKLRRTLEGQAVDPTPTFTESETEGLNCNRIFAHYYRETSELPQQSRRLVGGFLWLLRTSLQDMNGEGFCSEQNASEIVDIASPLVDEKRQQYQSQFPIQRELLIQLTVIFFEWLYLNKYTNHVIKQIKN